MVVETNPQWENIVRFDSEVLWTSASAVRQTDADYGGFCMCSAVLIHPKKPINSGTPCVSELCLTWMNAAPYDLQWVASPVQILFHMTEICRSTRTVTPRTWVVSSIIIFIFKFLDIFYREIYRSINFFFFSAKSGDVNACRESHFEGGSISNRPIHGICRLITEL